MNGSARSIRAQVSAVLTRDGFKSVPWSWLELIILAVVWGVLFYERLDHSPIFPLIETDSPDYIAGAAYRPQGYHLFLSAYALLFDDFRYLPQFQLTLFALVVLYFCLALGKHIGSLLPTVLIVVGALYAAPFENYDSVMSDTLFTACLVASVAAFLDYLRSDRLSALAVSSFTFGLALVTRTVGIAAIPVFGVALALHAYRLRYAPRRIGSAALLTVLPVIFWINAASVSNYVKNGSYMIGSWGGMSLLGKGLIVARPFAPGSGHEQLNWIADEMKPIRRALSGVDDPVLKALLIRQYYEVLRYFVFWQRFNDKIPGWREASSYESGVIAGQIAKPFVRHNLPDYLELAALDYLSLWLIPRRLTASEHQHFDSKYKALGPFPVLADFARTTEGSWDYYQVVPAASNPIKVWFCRIAVAIFLTGTAILLVEILRRGQTLDSTLEACLLLYGIVHSGYLVTAIMEAGLERYTAPTWPILIGASILLVARITSSSPVFQELKAKVSNR